jgi:hypothetical protein
MSDNQQPEEPLIIKTDRPHTVSMPEGTNVAVGKKGEQLEPSVRKVLADADEHPVENLVMDGGVSKSADQNKDVISQDPNFKGYQGAADMPDRFVSNDKQAAVPAPVRKAVDVTQLDSILKPQEKPVGVDAIETKAETAAPAPEEPVADFGPEPEMDFPARVINLKIENDQLRARLDVLE